MTRIMRITVLALVGLFFTLTLTGEAWAQNEPGPGVWTQGQPKPTSKATPPPKAPPKPGGRRFTGGGNVNKDKDKDKGKTPKCHPLEEVKDPDTRVFQRCQTLDEALAARDKKKKEEGKADAKTNELLLMFLLAVFALGFGIFTVVWVRRRLDEFMTAVVRNRDRLDALTGTNRNALPPPPANGGDPPANAA